MKETLFISYNWRRVDGRRVKNAHKEALRESAIRRAINMMKRGCVEGELCDNIRMTDSDPEDGLEYTGWWSVKTE